MTLDVAVSSSPSLFALAQALYTGTSPETVLKAGGILYPAYGVKGRTD